MKRLLIITALLLIYPVFAACPIEKEGAACLAEFQLTDIPALPMNNLQLSAPNAASKFSATPATVDSAREITPTKNLRNFGANNQDYGYNSNCQFGVCLDRGMPKIFPEENN